MDQPNVVTNQREPWNKGKFVGQKSPKTWLGRAIAAAIDLR